MHRDEVLLVLVALTLPLADVRDVHHCNGTDTVAWGGCTPRDTALVPNPPGDTRGAGFVPSCSQHPACTPALVLLCLARAPQGGPDVPPGPSASSWC